MPSVGVVVVSYNTREYLRRCLASIPTGIPTVVVDNASRDGSADMVAAEFPDVDLVRSDVNLGFGAANNLGTERLNTDLVLLLNSDAIVTAEAIAKMSEAFSETVVAVGPMLRFPDGRPQASACRRLTLWAVFCEQTFLERLFHSYWIIPAKELPAIVTVDQVMGACMMLRPIEPFDERFFLYCEDTELCRRLQRHGEILYLPKVSVTHALGASSSSSRWEAVARYNRGKELYFEIHHGRGAAAACWLLNRLGALIRLLVWLVANSATLFSRADWREKIALFTRVLFAPLAGPPLPKDSGR
ncbi:MAG: hypothetical protein HONBIEJF_00494 [Fimbriimonadaceae bacterium]|nr:hypothetical protein [Fimbriimonadaceae bacterium]